MHRFNFPKSSAKYFQCKSRSLAWMAWLFIVFSNATICIAPRSIAQGLLDGVPVLDDAPNAQQDDPILGEAAIVQVHEVAPVDWVDSWIFGGISRQAATDRLSSQIERRIEKISKQCNLSEEQRSIVSLACEGDMERFFRKVASVRKQLAGKQLDNGNMREFSEIVLATPDGMDRGAVST